MLTKMKNIRKKSQKNFFQKLKKTSEHMAQGKQQPNLKEICALGSEIIATWTHDGRHTTDDGRI